MTHFFAATNSEISEREKRNMERSRRIASDSIVLLENNGVLPLNRKIKEIALFGNGARHTVKGGTGSGDVNSRFVVNVEQGMEDAGLIVTTKNWLDRFDIAVEEARKVYSLRLKKMIEDAGNDMLVGLLADPFREPPIVEVTEKDIEESNTDTAVYIVARNSGEGKDRRPVPGEYELFEEEKKAIKTLTARYAHVIVVLNVGGVIDTKFFRQTKGIDAVILMGQLGNIGGHALMDVLMGKVNPSGHLTSTWAENYMDYPKAADFSHMNGNVDDEYYEEGIYVGYRYFDTFNVTPAYPFGYGLSYTGFESTVDEVSVQESKVNITVTVFNTGDKYSGKDVVQIYYSAPKGRLEKPYQELVCYAKTGEVAPGESQVLKMSFPVERMAVYDEINAVYLLEAGTYYIRIGSDSRNTHIVAALVLEQDVITKKLSNRLPLDCEMNQLSAENTVSLTYKTEKEEMKDAVKIIINPSDLKYEVVVYGQESKTAVTSNIRKKITADDVKSGNASLDEMVGQLTVEEMAELCVGTARGGLGEGAVIGSASGMCPGAAGETTLCMIKDRNIRNMVLADGPAGLRLAKSFLADKEGRLISGGGIAIPEMECLTGGTPKKEIPEDAVNYYQYCTAIPIATNLAQTWDVEAIEEAGDIVGEEMVELGITLWLAPGMNIHRNPLCGRNFEYYSEDPLVSGMCAAADTLGVQKHSGIGTTIKHFAFNNQEDNRMHTNAHISERAIREIYLKGFEIAVKSAQPMSIMTSYNIINGVHTANSYDLLTAIARDEWGFQGIVMTDWGTTWELDKDAPKKFKYTCSSAAGCIKAGNDLIMPGSQDDYDDIVRSVGADQGSVACPITLGELQACAKRMLNIILQSSAYDRL